MTAARVVLHAVVAVLPIFLAGLWVAANLPSIEEFIGYGFGVGCFLALFAAMVSWMPLFVLYAIRRGGRAPGDEGSDLRPVHPIGWIMPLGVWGHLAIVAALVHRGVDSVRQGDTILMIGLPIVALFLSWRYVASSSRSR
jgi:hypothetical protein